MAFSKVDFSKVADRRSVVPIRREKLQGGGHGVQNITDRSSVQYVWMANKVQLARGGGRSAAASSEHESITAKIDRSIQDDLNANVVLSPAPAR